MHCTFGDQLDAMLRDRLVCGVVDEALQRRLLAEPTLTFKEAEEKALAAETALLNARLLRQQQHESLPQDDVHYAAHTHASAAHKVAATSEYKKRNKSCYRCGGQHIPQTCKFSTAVCHYCKKRGHIARVCLTKARHGSDKDSAGSTAEQHTNIITHDPQNEYSVYSATPKSKLGGQKPYLATVILNKQAHTMEVDSVAACSLISEHTYHSLWPSQPPEMHADNGVLKQWSQATLEVKGKIFVEVMFKATQKTLPLFVIRGQGPSLLGRDWFDALGISIEGVHRVQLQSIEEILAEYSEVFQDIGVCRTPPISIDIDSTVTPRFFKARPVPFALRPQLDEELDKLVAQGIFEPVRHAKWATPIVAVAKKDGGLRICYDYRCTVNTAVKPDVYPIPTASELFSKLAGGEVFTKLDLKQAYQQLPLDDQSADLLTINTHHGLFRARRLQFGVSTAVSMFQRFMDTLLAGIPGVQPYLDEILISGKTMEEHNTRLRAVLK